MNCFTKSKPKDFRILGRTSIANLVGALGVFLSAQFVLAESMLGTIEETIEVHIDARINDCYIPVPTDPPTLCGIAIVPLVPTTIVLRKVNNHGWVKSHLHGEWTRTHGSFSFKIMIDRYLQFDNRVNYHIKGQVFRSGELDVTMAFDLPNMDMNFPLFMVEGRFTEIDGKMLSPILGIFPTSGHDGSIPIGPNPTPVLR